jgi:RNA polymerase sigma-70 factor (ECF subfamily)
MDLDGRFSSKAYEDLQLVKEALEGNNSAYTKLMSRYKDSIYFMVLKMVHNRSDAEDLTIEAFGKAFRNLAKYSPEYAFSTWLFKIATNNCIDFIRKKRVKTVSMDQPMIKDDDGGTTLEHTFGSDSDDPEDTFIKQQRHEKMRELVEALSPKYRELIDLRYFQEHSYEEIAEELNLPLGTVKAQLFRAKELLYNMLKHKKERY